MTTIKPHRWLGPMYLLLLAAVTGLAGCDSGGSNNSKGGSDPLQEPSEPQPVFQSYEVPLGGEQGVPRVHTGQSANATVTINETDGTVKAEVDLRDVMHVNSAHIRAAEVGSNGPVVFNFSDVDEDGVWKVKEEAVTRAQHDALLTGNWYVNVHTDSFPGGELRGQVLTDTQSIHLFALSGDQQVPPVATDAYGQGYLLYDSGNGTLTLNTWAWNLTATAAYIRHAEAGMNGEIVAGWEVNARNDSVWQLPEETILGSDEVTALHRANLYVDIHTEAHAGGEIRGQILPDDYTLLLFDLSPGQTVPRVESSARGAGYATLDTESGGLRMNVWSTNMQTNAAHIHLAGIGESGARVLGLEEHKDIAGLWQVPENTALASATQALLLSGGHYVDMHSDAHPGGELRGQIIPAPWSLLAFALGGSQVVPAVDTTAEGDGYVLVNTASGELIMVVNTRNLDTASAAHIHAAPAGVNGAALINLEQDSADVSIWRLPADTSLDESTLAKFLDAGHYVSVHSPSNPDGEIRGQIIR